MKCVFCRCIYVCFYACMRACTRGDVDTRTHTAGVWWLGRAHVWRRGQRNDVTQHPSPSPVAPSGVFILRTCITRLCVCHTPNYVPLCLLLFGQFAPILWTMLILKAGIIYQSAIFLDGSRTRRRTHASCRRVNIVICLLLSVAIATSVTRA